MRLGMTRRSMSIAASTTSTPAVKPATTASALGCGRRKAATAVAIAIGTTNVGGHGVRAPSPIEERAAGAEAGAMRLVSLNERPAVDALTVGLLDCREENIERPPAVEDR